jgi:hypothetical protein
VLAAVRAVGIAISEAYEKVVVDLLRLTTKAMDLFQGGNRATLQFFEMRAPCSCLKAKYKDVRDLAQAGSSDIVMK